MADKKIAYFNTLIFTVITGIVSLIVLSFLFFDFGKAFIYLIVIFEMGVFIIIGTCIYFIIKAEGDKKNKTDYLVNIDQCPDYYTKTTNVLDGKDYCLNYHQGSDALGTRVLTRIFPMKNANGDDLMVSRSIRLSEISPVASQSDYNNFPLYSLQTDEKLNDTAKRCDAIFRKPSASLGTNGAYDSHSLMPWTYARSRCAGLSEFA